MSDAIAMPGPWAVGTRKPRWGHEQNQQNHPHAHQNRGGRRARREAFLAAMAAEGGPGPGSTPDDADRTPRRGGRGRRGGPPFGGPPFGGGRGRARRGDVRAAILALLGEGPHNGYGVIQEIEERSNGVWKPSPGAVYPAIQQLEDEVLIRPVEVDGRKLFELTPEGRAYLEANPSPSAPWDEAAQGGGGTRDAKHQLAKLWHAYSAVRQDGTPEQVAAASKVLDDARKTIYRILAEDDEPAS